jgi:putative DNA primase/helicase
VQSVRKPLSIRYNSRYSLTDCGNAERLVDQFGDCIRFCGATGQWFLWKGNHWATADGAVVQLAKKTVRTMQQERKHMINEAESRPDGWEIKRRRADALDKWAIRSEAAPRIIAMLRMAESDPRISIELEDFDKSPWMLNLHNGSIDLHCGRLRKHRPEELLTKLAGAEFDSNMLCPLWTQFLAQVFEPHPEIIPFLQRAVGYTLTGETQEECVFVLAGSGRNGKSTFLSILHRILGQYSGVAEMDTFLASHGTPLREDIADMRGRRFVSAQEPMLDGKFAEGTLKWVSGGDRLRARRLYEHAQEFQPSHKLWLAVNRVPALRIDDSAAWSRLRVIPFDVSFANSPNLELKVELQDELSGILNWALRGCLLWQRDGLGSIESVTNATEMWRKRGRMIA